MTLTPARLERALRDLLTSGKVRVAMQPMKDCAGMVNLDGKPPMILVDPMDAGFINIVVHELIHLVYEKELAVWGKLEEPVVEALEASLVSFINQSERRVNWWRNRILELLKQNS